MKTTAAIRQSFLDFFASKGHRIVPSSPLVPGNDPTLLFTNAGMVQFKDVFLGADPRSYTRAASAQRCVRAGGKHNDLDQVGYTARHHTFFEMLGNFSFGDYFKREAIRYAWELLTEVYGLPAERLWATVYHSDDEAWEIWHREIGLPAERIVRIGDKGDRPFDSDNFWQMADTGPCGPCSEIFYDHGPEVAGGPPGSADQDGDRYIEIWNLVFMQFDRASDGSLKPLPKPCVDTGMGLERLAAVLQHVHSNYDIDLFRALVAAAGRLTGQQNLDQASLRVIADHIRACAFLVLDGVLPSNEGRGYVLRRIIRRALRHGHKLGQNEPFFHRMVAPLVEQMGAAYPELAQAAERIGTVLEAEELRFAETLGQGMRVFEELSRQASGGVLDGEAVFKLYDTYGFPVDLTADVARERGLGVDLQGFEAAMERQRERARAASQFAAADALDSQLIASLPRTEFTGYERLSEDGCTVLALLRDGRALDRLTAGQTATLILDRTPFYAESGGQVGDQGRLLAEGLELRVLDVQKLAGVYHGHRVELVFGELRPGQVLRAEVDAERRKATVLNHSATHLLHAALRQVLGSHVQQKGSLVAPDRLRFDFSHHQPVSREELERIEALVNAKIRANADAEVSEMAFDEAIAAGALALFGEKYGERVRVLRLGDFSIELCGGTHVERAGDIGLFRILSESGVASGVRRIEAVTGEAALAETRRREQRLRRLESLLGAHGEDVIDRLEQVLERSRRLESELQGVKSERAREAGARLAERAVLVDGIKVLAARLDGQDARSLRESLDRLKQQLGDAVIVLASGLDGRLSLVAGVSGAATGRVKAGELVQEIASRINGKGGGRADMAQGGGEDGPAAEAALAALPQIVDARLRASAH